MMNGIPYIALVEAEDIFLNFVQKHKKASELD